MTHSIQYHTYLRAIASGTYILEETTITISQDPSPSRNTCANSLLLFLPGISTQTHPVRCQFRCQLSPLSIIPCWFSLSSLAMDVEIDIVV